MNQTNNNTNELQASLTLLNERLHFSGKVDNKDPVSIDYIQPLGDNLGYTSLELLLLSLGSCTGSSVLTLLRKMKKDIQNFTINIRGIRRSEHPTGFESIFIEMYISTSNATDADIEQVLKLSEDKYCPVWAMVKGNVEVNIKSTILQTKQGSCCKEVHRT
jgi:putative redox protein